MNVYDVIKAALVEAVPEAEGRIYHIMTEYKNENALIDDQKPFVTYQFETLSEIMNMDGGSGVFKARMEIDCFGATPAVVSAMDQKICTALISGGVNVEAELALVPEPDSGTDVFETDEIRRFVRMWKGLIQL